MQSYGGQPIEQRQDAGQMLTPWIGQCNGNQWSARLGVSVFSPHIWPRCLTDSVMYLHSALCVCEICMSVVACFSVNVSHVWPLASTVNVTHVLRSPFSSTPCMVGEMTAIVV